MATLTNPLILLLIFPFFPVRHHDSDSAHRFHSPSHSQLLLEPKPSCPSSLLCCVNDKEMQWEALNRSMWRSLFEILQVLFFTPRRCKSPSTPSVTSLLPCALTPLTSSHSGSELPTLPWLPSSVKKSRFPTIPWRCGWCFLLPRLWVVFIQGKRNPHTYFCGFSSDASPWPYGSGNKEVWK